MRLAGFVVLAVMGCGVDEPATSQVQAADTSSQGSSMQGSSMQGSSMQGSSMQGSSMQGSSMQGATLGGLSASGITISGTAIIAWTHNADGTWDQRTPNRLCHYKSDKTTLIGCTTVFKSNPLVGLTFTGSFIGPNGSATARVRIASVASDSTTQAMFPVTGTANATHQNCENPAGCSSNADLWLYDVNLPDFIEPNGLPVSLCPAEIGRAHV